jgi:hypothetical protein
LRLIDSVFSFILGARKPSERGGQLLKLLAGLMMLELGLVMIMALALLNSAGVTMPLLCVALLLTFLAANFLPE